MVSLGMHVLQCVCARLELIQRTIARVNILRAFGELGLFKVCAMHICEYVCNVNARGEPILSNFIAYLRGFGDCAFYSFEKFIVAHMV